MHGEINRMSVRRCSLLVMMMVMAFVAVAAPITQAQALRLAQDFLSGHHRGWTAPSKDGQLHPESVVTGKGYYIFNLQQQGGFIVISNDDMLAPVLGYADSGCCDPSDLPDGLKAWLAYYDECAEAVQRGVAVASSPRRIYSSEVITPLITSRWAQREPYNSLCPVDGGTTCPTGCTATALAQVMRYHRFPTGYSTAIPSYTTLTKGFVMPRLPATLFDWNNMPDELNAASSQNSINAVAKLMLYCGQATKMNYCADGSGAYSYLIPDCLPKYFGYPKTMHYVYRESYDEQQWDSLLINELRNNQPVIYTAYNNVSQGHTFICDGYDGNGLFHINWGWAGVGDGYFRISVAHATDENLSDHVKNYHLSISQTAVLGLKPSGTDTYIEPVEYLRSYSRPSLKNGRAYTRKATSANFSGITFKQSFVNTTSASKTLSYGVALIADNGSIVSVLTSSSATLASGGMQTYEAANLALGSGITSGHYQLKLVYKRSSSSEWRVMGGSDKNHIDVVISQLNMQLTPVPKADFELRGLEKNGDFLHFDFDNNDEEFFGPVYLRKLDKANNNIVQVAFDNMSVSPGSNTKFDLYIPPGQSLDINADQFFLSVDEYDSQYFYSNSEDKAYHVAKEIEIINLDGAAQTIVGDRIMCRVTFTNQDENAYDKTIMLSLVNVGVSEIVIDSCSVSIGRGESLERYYEIPLTDFSTKYQLKASHRRNVYSWAEQVTDVLSAAKGAIYWTSDGETLVQQATSTITVPADVVAANVRNAYTSNVIANANPNTLYMLDKTMPRGLSGKNYVNGSNKGPKLSLTDGYDYFIPDSMVFSTSLDYHGQVGEVNGFSWRIISLPFKPAQVTVDGETVTWYKDEDDEAGSFWLMAFEGVENGTVQTSYVQEMNAYTPYIIAFDERMSGKSFSFTASKQTIGATAACDNSVTKGNYTLYGSNRMQTVPVSLILVGDKFQFAPTGNHVDAFGGWLVCDESGKTTLDIDLALRLQEEKGLMGDVNNDGVVNVSDIMMTVNEILGNKNPYFISSRGDINGDGIINVSDVMGMVNIILQ